MRKEDSPTGISSGRRPGKTRLSAHEKWLLDLNYQHHFAHEHREDGCHSPAAVLGWVKGMQPEPELPYPAFSAVGEMRTITKAGYVRFRDYLLYGEQNLAGERALVNLFQDILTLEYNVGKTS